MYCSNCGNELPNNVRFCSCCGFEIAGNAIVQADNTQLSSYSTEQTEMNRKVLIMYLDNLRTLEFSQNKLEQQNKNIEYDIRNLAHSRDVIKSKVEWSMLGAAAIFGAIFVLANILKSNMDDGGLWSLFKLVSPIISLALILAPIIAIICIVVLVADIVKDKQRYEEEIQAEESRMRLEINQKNELKQILPIVKNELRETSNLLEEAYSLNIIPVQFRNSGCIFFIHQFMASSSMSLNEALLQCKLDEISEKLDTIIEQNDEIIFQLARNNALNEQIIEQNNRIYDSAIRAERNAERAAQYQEMAAIEQKKISQIQTYYFYKNGL